MDYVGADAFARLLCDDKSLARDFARRVGFEVPSAVLADTAEDQAKLDEMDFPVVVKPTIGGMSMGVVKIEIGDNRKLSSVVAQVQHEFKCSALVERFAPGREVMIVLLGRGDNPDLCCATEIYRLDDEQWFHNRIFSADLKRTMSKAEWGIRTITHELPAGIIELCHDAFRRLGNIQYLRIDGRLAGDKFTFIEFSPTPHFWPLTALACAARDNGFTLASIVRRLVDLARTH